MKRILIALALVMSLVGTAVAEDRIYILGDRDVVMVISAESAGQNPVIIDCQAKDSSDPIGCIIAFNDLKTKQLAKRHNNVKRLHTSK